MKETILFIASAFLVVLMFNFATPKIDSSIQFHYSQWLDNYQNNFKNSTDREQVLIKFVQKGNPQGEYIVSTKEGGKISRILSLLKRIEAFNNDIKNCKEGDYLVSVESGDNKFEGVLSQKKLQKDIRMQVLLKLVETV